jgi:hypothetical protein
MKQSQRLILAVLAALAMTALAGAPGASATTLETKGVAENAAVTLKTSLASGGSLLMTDTFGVSVNTCTSSTIEGTTSTLTGTVVEGAISAMSWNNCSEGTPTVDAKGSFNIRNIAGTTNGTLNWSGSKWTTPSFFGPLTCTTENTDLGTLNGKKEGTATLTINAVISCTGIGTMKWSGTYIVTSPVNIGVGA